ncbi:fiber-2 [Bovine adenovirus 10]|nr:fiber-2 [Bovine adenovirus 10]
MLWTTPDPSPNLNLEGERTAKLFLSLSYCNGSVIGTVAIRGLKEPVETIENSRQSFKVILLFNHLGQLSGGNLYTGYFGYRFQNSVLPNSNIQGTMLMPNSVAYPRVKNNVGNYYETTCYLAGNKYPVKLRVSLNSDSPMVDWGYSITFEWYEFDNHIGAPFLTTYTSFTYISET